MSSDILDRYVHQVGRFLPPAERDDIEKELRSLLLDQLDDRLGDAPSAAEVAAVLREFGEPRQIAASYRRAQYLVGPGLYPYLMAVLHNGWLYVPSVFVFFNLFIALLSAEGETLLSLFIETAFVAAQGTFVFSALVVLVFALLERAGFEPLSKKTPFNPLELPARDDPTTVDRFEVAFGVALSVFFVIVFLYFLAVGGLTLRFDLHDPGTVIETPVGWHLLLVANVFLLLGLYLLTLLRNRRPFGIWLAQLALQLIGVIFLYFTVLGPLAGPTRQEVAERTGIFFTAALPEIIATGLALLILVDESGPLLKFWKHRRAAVPVSTLQ